MLYNNIFNIQMSELLLSKMPNGSICYFEVDRLPLQEFITYPEKYRAQLLVSKNNKKCFLELRNIQDGKIIKYFLNEFKQNPKYTVSFKEGHKGVQLGPRIEYKCSAYVEKDAAKKRTLRQAFTQIAKVDSQDEDDEVLSIPQEQKVIATEKTYTDRHDENRNKRIRGQILRIMQQNSSEGLITPAEVRRKLFEDYKDNETEKYIREIMQAVCEPSLQKNNKRYILLSQYRSSDQGSEPKKRVKYE